MYKPITILLLLTLSSCTVGIKNDLFSGTDEDFTHGTEFTYHKSMEDAPARLQSLAKSLPDLTLGGTEDPTHLEVTVGQHIYTPDDLRTAEVIKDDNPYAGWLFGTVKRQVLKEDEKREVGVTVGLIGKYSFSEHAQKFVHNDLGRGTDPKGWDNQLDQEVGFVGSASRQTRFFLTTVGPLEVDGIHGVDARIGNIHTDLGYGAQVRVGKGLPGFNGYSSKWSLYGYAGSNGRLVGRNIFYDGNTFKDSHSVGSEPLVGDLSAGVVTQVKGFELGMHYKLTSPEHEQREGSHSVWYLSISRALDLFD